MKNAGLMFCLVILNAFGAAAQVRQEAYMPALFIDVDANAGILDQRGTPKPLSLNYPDVVNPYSGKLTFSTGTNTFADIQVGYYIDRKRTFGIGLGLMLSKDVSTIGLDSFHAEYKATDYKGNVFRQVVSTDHPVSETITRNSINIPVLLYYKRDISRSLFFSADAGLVYNIQLQNTWSTNANFNYEAIYEFTGSGSDVSTIYDNGAVPGSKDLIQTQSQVTKNNGDVATYFSTRNAAGYSIGLNEHTNKSSGTFKLAPGSLGYTAAAGLNIKLTRKIYFKLGAYYLAQTFSNTPQNNASPLTNKITRNSSGQDAGVDYNSLINSVSTLHVNSYGLTLGVKIFLSRNSLLDFEPAN